MQYTVRNVPSTLDQRIRALCAEEGRSLNDVVLRLLRTATGLTDEPKRRDLSDVVGTWVPDAIADQAIAAQRHIDEGMWT